MTSLTDLLEMVEKADSSKQQMFLASCKAFEDCTDSTALIHKLIFDDSVDAALELVERELPGCDIELQMRTRTPSHHCTIQHETASGESINRPLPALAVLSALIKAKIEIEETG